MMRITITDTEDATLAYSIEVNGPSAFGVAVAWVAESDTSEGPVCVPMSFEDDYHVRSAAAHMATQVVDLHRRMDGLI